MIESNAADAASTRLQRIFDLNQDQAHPDKIDATIRANVQMSGTNLWVLILAIVIASIGLNVNSTAVVIGAMLISPLMGPIVGMGYGAAVSDMKLIHTAIRNIIIFTAISLFTATIYFLITPLQQAQSELVARTQPTLWDVLIAFFGGSAGMLGITRKEGGNVIPGVAIATALMPPLCTAGFGLAHGDWQFFFGAFYLFTINCVFIAFSSLLFTRLIKLPRRGLVTHSQHRLHRFVIASVTIIVMMPSAYLTTRLVRQELFNTTATDTIKEVQNEEGFFILNTKIDHTQKLINLIVSNTKETQKISQLLTQKLEAKGIKHPQVNVLNAEDNEANLALLKKELEANQINNAIQIQNQLKQQQSHIESLLATNAVNKNDEAILKEIQAQYPEAEKIILGRGLVFKQAPISASPQTTASQVSTSAPVKIESSDNNKVPIIWMKLPEALSAKEYERLHAWLVQRLENTTVRLIIESDQTNNQKTARSDKQ